MKSSTDKYGNQIPHVQDSSSWRELQDNEIDKAYCFYNNNKKNSYGALYTYAAAKIVCPKGWRLPSVDDWSKLHSFVAKNGFQGDEMTVLRSDSAWIFYDSTICDGTNNFDFNVLPVGVRANKYRTFSGKGAISHFWTSSTYSERYAYGEYYTCIENTFRPGGHGGMSSGFSVRCVKDD